ncbi:MAG: hypothetical protein ACREN2_10180 [Candidatus Dormibacteria bacterium]
MTIALLALGFVAMIGLFAVVVVVGRSPANDAQLATQARQVADYLGSENLAYHTCGTAGQYDTDVQTARASNPPKLTIPPTTAAHVIAVNQATGGTDTFHGAANTPLVPKAGCVGAPPDYGVQQLEIKLQVLNSNQSVTRIVYKRWN